MLSDEAFESYMIAGKAVGHALNLAKMIVRPGSKYIDVATLIEQDIIDQGATGWSFPINMSLDNEAAHYSPVVNDPKIIPNKGLLKVDIGSHYNGYIADAAITINLGGDDGIYEELIKAAQDGLYAAIKNFKPGVPIKKIGSIIQHNIEKHKGVKPISNLGGHQLEQYNLHAGVFVPNVGGTRDNYILKEGDQFAVEPFTTNGHGSVMNGKSKTIYMLQKINKKGIKLEEKVRLAQWKKQFTTLPFSPRWIEKIPASQIPQIMSRYESKGIVSGYQIFMERGGGLVAQAEHTLVIKDGKAIPTTWHEDFDYKTLY